MTFFIIRRTCRLPKIKMIVYLTYTFWFIPMKPFRKVLFDAREDFKNWKFDKFYSSNIILRLYIYGKIQIISKKKKKREIVERTKFWVICQSS